MKFKFFSIILFLGNVLTVGAQDFEVSPVQLYFSANPGESQSKTITVKNHSAQKSSYILSAGDFVISSDGDKQYKPANSTKNSIANWMSISPSFFDLEPNAERQVTVSVQPPTDDDGSRWGAIFVRTTEEKTTFESDAKLSAGITIS